MNHPTFISADALGAMIFMAVLIILGAWYSVPVAHSIAIVPESIIQAVHDAHAYVPEIYNCDNYTLDALHELRAAGFNATYMTGCRLNAENTTECHAWPRVCTPEGCRDYDVTAGIQEPDYVTYDTIQLLRDR
jgi:hypothetical protein